MLAVLVGCFAPLVTMGVAETSQERIARLRTAVAAGDISAMLDLGARLEWGEAGLDADPRAAMALYETAAKKGNAAAAYNLGRMFFDARGTERDGKKAAQYFRQAADAGRAEAQYQFGMMLMEGEHVPQNDAEGFKFLRAAAAQMEGSAVMEVGLAYASGRGVARDTKEAAAWLKLADSMYASGAGHQLDKLLQADPKLADVPAKAESEVKQLAAGGAAGKKPRDYAEYGANLSAADIELIQKAESGDPAAERTLSDKLRWGGGAIKKNPVKAAAWLQRVVDRGDAAAMKALADFYMVGSDDPAFPKNVSAGVELHKKAALAGSASSAMTLGSFYSNDSELGAKNLPEAFKWYLKAAELGSPVGQYSAGLLYMEGRGVAANKVEAAKWLQKAVAQGDANAKKLLERLGPIPTPEKLEGAFAPLAADFLKAFNAAGDLEAREDSIRKFSNAVSAASYSVGATKADVSAFVIATLMPLMQAAPGEAGAFVFAIDSRAYDFADVPKLPAAIQTAVRSHGQKVSADYQQSQRVAGELRQLEDNARSGGAAAKTAVARRYLQAAQASPSDADRYNAKAIFWLRQVQATGDKSGDAVIAELEVRFEKRLAALYARKAGWKAYYLCEAMAGAGYPGAAKEAGMIMLTGRDGANKDPKKAREWFAKAVELGDATAAAWAEFAGLSATDAEKTKLAYERGEAAAVGKEGAAMNWADAKAWYLVAQSMGHPQAAGRLVELSELQALAQGANKAGEQEVQAGLTAYNAKDYAKAIESWKSGAAKGNGQAMFNLGAMYESGFGVEPSLLEAKAWYEKARDKGVAKAVDVLPVIEQAIAQGGVEAEEGDRAAGKKDYAAAEKVWRTAAGKGNSAAMFNLGVMSQNAWGVKRSYVNARAWYEKARVAGMPKAEKAVKDMDAAIAKGAQDTADGVAAYEEKKYDDALRFLTIGAGKGDAYAAYYLGYYHERGDAGKMDRAQALTWYEKSAALGHPEGAKAAESMRSQLVGADEYNKGKAAFDAKKYTEAVSWYEKSANLGNVHAMTALGSFYMTGGGEIFDDRAKAKFWLKKAVAKGDGFGGIMLKSLEESDYLAAMVPRVTEGPPKGPSLVKGSLWTADDVLAALHKDADHMSLAIALRVDGTDLYYGDYLRIQNDPAGAKIVDHSRLSNALAGGHKPGAGAWARELAKAAIAARKAQVKVAPRAVDSSELRAKASSGDPAAAYAVFNFTPEELTLGELSGPLARNYQQMAELAVAKNYAPALWIAADMLVNQVDKAKNDPVKRAEYLRRSAESGDPRGAYRYAQLFVDPGEIAVAHNFAEAEYWFIEAGARGEPKDFSIMPPEFALELLYSAMKPIGFQGMEPLVDAPALRWCRELMRRGGPAAEHASRVLEKWRREKNAKPVDEMLKKLPPEVPPILAAEVAKLDAAARRGDVAAALKLGDAYASGRGVRQNDAGAVEYYRLAADKGSVLAMKTMAVAYARGHGVKKDVFERVAWLEKAGAAGDAAAWLEVGDLRHFANESGGEAQDYPKAIVAYEKAIAGGNLPAFRNLSIMYEQGRGVEKDPKKSEELLVRGATAGDVSAMGWLGSIYSGRKEYEQARVWYQKAVDSGDESLNASLGRTFVKLGQTDRAIEAFRAWLVKNPNSSQVNFELAEILAEKGEYRAAIDHYRKATLDTSEYNVYRQWSLSAIKRMEEELNPAPGSVVALRQQADKGDTAAMVQLVLKLAPTDKASALEWLKKAAAKENPQAMLMLGLETAATDKTAALALIEKSATAGNLEAKYRLGVMQIQGKEMPLNATRGLALLTEAADGGFAPAQIDLGRMLIVGAPGITAAPERGIGYLRGAVNQGAPQAAFLLGEAHERGAGVPVNLREALRWYQQAMKGGIKEASAAVSRVQMQLGGKSPPPAAGDSKKAAPVKK